MECPIGGPRCFEGCAQGNLALNYSPMSHTTERSSVPHNATLSPCYRRRFRAAGSGGPPRILPDGRDLPPTHGGPIARGAHVAPPMVSEGLKGPFACSASMKGLSL